MDATQSLNTLLQYSEPLSSSLENNGKASDSEAEVSDLVSLIYPKLSSLPATFLKGKDTGQVSGLLEIMFLGFSPSFGSWQVFENLIMEYGNAEFLLDHFLAALHNFPMRQSFSFPGCLLRASGFQDSSKQSRFLSVYWTRLLTDIQKVKFDFDHFRFVCAFSAVLNCSIEILEKLLNEINAGHLSLKALLESFDPSSFLAYVSEALLANSSNYQFILKMSKFLLKAKHLEHFMQVPEFGDVLLLLAEHEPVYYVGILELYRKDSEIIALMREASKPVANRITAAKVITCEYSALSRLRAELERDWTRDDAHLANVVIGDLIKKLWVFEKVRADCVAPSTVALLDTLIASLQNLMMAIDIEDQELMRNTFKLMLSLALLKIKFRHVSSQFILIALLQAIPSFVFAKVLFPKDSELKRLREELQIHRELCFDFISEEMKQSHDSSSYEVLVSLISFLSEAGDSRGKELGCLIAVEHFKCRGRQGDGQIAEDLGNLYGDGILSIEAIQFILLEFARLNCPQQLRLVAVKGAIERGLISATQYKFLSLLIRTNVQNTK